MNDQPNGMTDRTITLRHFWSIKLSLILFMCICMIAIGYWLGSRRMEFAQELARANNQLEYPGLAYARDGVTHCYDSGNWYRAKMISTRGQLPMFKATKD